MPTDEECRPCGRGHRRLLSCGYKNAVCEACESGYFSMKTDQSTECNRCSTKCKTKNMRIVRRCSSINDIVCECPQGQFLRSPYEHSCEQHSSCPLGSGMDQRGTPTSDTACVSCRNGTFSNVDSPIVTCNLHTSCTLRGGVRQFGNNTTDNICNDSIAQQGGQLPVWAISLLAIFSSLIFLAIIITLIYCVCWRRGVWRQVKRALSKRARSTQSIRRNDLNADTEEDREGPIQYIISSANIREDASSKALNTHLFPDDETAELNGNDLSPTFYCPPSSRSARLSSASQTSTGAQTPDVMNNNMSHPIYADYALLNQSAGAEHV